MGGLSRRAYQIKQIQSEQDKPVILLDGGSLFFADPVVAESLLPAKKVQAEGISRSMQKMAYDAIGVAPLDLSGGPDFLTRQFEKYALPLVSANLLSTKNKAPLFNPYLIKQAGNISLAFIGLTGEPVQPAGRRADPYRIAGWQETLPGILRDIEDQADMIILLSSYPEPVNMEIANRFDNIHLIVQSGHSTANKIPNLVGNTVIIQSGSKGKYMGRMDVSWNEAHRWQQDIPPQLKRAKERLDRINWRLGRMAKRSEEQQLQQNQAYLALLSQREKETAEIARLEKLAEEEQEIMSTYRNSFVPLAISLPEDKEVQEIVLQTKADVNQAGRKKLSELQDTSRTMRSAMLANMVGWQRCQGCHPKQTAFWQKTGHASAWETLAKAKQQFNQDCIVCHVTLPTYNITTIHTENLLSGLTQDFHGVGCEACHGPGREHADKPGETQPRKPDAETCLLCHTPDQDPHFEFKEKVRLIRCPADSL